MKGMLTLMFMDCDINGFVTGIPITLVVFVEFIFVLVESPLRGLCVLKLAAQAPWLICTEQTLTAQYVLGVTISTWNRA